MLAYALAGIGVGIIGVGTYYKIDQQSEDLNPFQKSIMMASAIVLVASIAATCGWAIQAVSDRVGLTEKLAPLDLSTEPATEEPLEEYMLPPTESPN